MTLEELQVVITAQTAGLRSELGRVNTQLGSVKKQATKSADGISKAFRKAARVIAAIGIGKIIKDSFTDAAQVNTNIENLSKILGENSTEFMNWANGQAKSFGIAKKEAMSYGMTFANLVSGFSGGTAQTAQITTQLLQTSSVIASKTGRSMEDVMERIRSGMLGNTEAVEDLGIYAHASALQQTQAYKTMSNGTSWNKLDYYTKQQIITFGLLEQASVKYGNTMSGGLTSQMLVFRAELSNLKTSLGQAFVPIVSAVIPYLMALIKHIQVAMSYVVAFVQLLFGVESATENSEKLANTAQEASNYLGSSAGNAGLTADNLGTAAKNAKKLRGELTGFDEINRLDMDDGADASVSVPSAGGSVGGGMGVPTFDKNLLTSVNTFNDNIDEAKKKLLKFGLQFDVIRKAIEVFSVLSVVVRDIDFKPLTDSFDRLKESIKPIVDTISYGLKLFIADIVVPLAEWTIEDALPAFFDLLAGALDVLNPILESFLKLGKRLWDDFLQPIAEWTGGVIVDTINGLADALTKVGDWMSENQSVVDGMTVAVVAFMAAWKGIELMAFIQMSGGIIGALTGITAAVWACTGAKLIDKAETIALTAMYAKDFVVSVASGTAKLVTQAAQWVINTGLKVADTVATGAMTVATGAWNVICGIATVVTTAFGAAVAFLTSPIGLVILAVAAIIAIIVLLVKNWDTVKEVAANVWNKIVEVWKAVAGWFYENVIQPIGDFFKGLWDDIVFVFSVVGTFFTDVFTGAFDGVKNAFSSIGSFFSGVWDGIKSVFGGVADWFGGVFTKAWTAVKNVFSTGGKIFEGIKDGILNGLKAVINGLIGGINKVISIPFKGINWALSKIKNINILGVEPFKWIETIGVPEIPRLARGGIVDSAQMFIAGEAGKEVVMPLENNTGWITQLAEKVSSRMPQGASNDRPIELTVKIGETTIGKLAIDGINALTKMNGSSGLII